MLSNQNSACSASSLSVALNSVAPCFRILSTGGLFDLIWSVSGGIVGAGVVLVGNGGCGTAVLVRMY